MVACSSAASSSMAWGAGSAACITRNKREESEARNTQPGDCMLHYGWLLITVAVCLAAACGRQPRDASSNWAGFVNGFIDTYFEANPLFAVYQGRHEYDGRFPDWSEAGLKRWMSRLHQLRDSAAAFSIDSSDSAAQLERDYVISVIDRDLFWGERADWPHRNPE